jgi:predicted DNA-binding transcriptional regulator AlpA
MNKPDKGGVSYVTLQTIAADLGVCRNTVRRLVELNILPRPIRLGRGKRAKKRWRRQDVDAALLATATAED